MPTKRYIASGRVEDGEAISVCTFEAATATAERKVEIACDLGAATR